MIFRKICAIFCVAIMTVSMMTACGKKEVKPMENSDNNEQQYTDWENAKWEENFDIKTPSGKEVNVDINITPCRWENNRDVPSRTAIKGDVSCKILTFEKIEMTAEIKEKIVKYFFGDTEVYHYEDDKVTKAVLTKRINLIENSLEYGEIPNRDRIANCKSLMSKAPTELMPITDYSGNMYLGYVDDIPFVIDFSLRRKSQNRLISTIIIQEAKELIDEENDFLKEFPKKFSEEEARQILGGLEEVIGTNYEKYFDEAYDYTLIAQEGNKCAGVILGMRPIIDIAENCDTINTPGDQTDCQIIAYTVGGRYVYYSSEDVSRIVSLQENVRILDFESLIECVRYEMQNNPEIAEVFSKNEQSGKILIKDFTLENAIVPGKGNERASVPVWNVGNILYFNAIDGSYIRMEK